MNQFRKSPRAQFLDYNQGLYFITICTRNKRHYFGEIIKGEMRYSIIGSFVKKQLDLANTFRDDINILLFVVMPNHVHFIIEATKYEHEEASQRNPNPLLRCNKYNERYIPLISSYINTLKGCVTKEAKRLGKEFKWQSRYHDHLIRNNHDCTNISNYILNNITKWESDCFYSECSFNNVN